MAKEKQNWFKQLFGTPDETKGRGSKDRRHVERKRLAYYIRVSDNDTGQIIGQVIDINRNGLSLDMTKLMPLERDFNLRLDLMDASFEKLFISFTARTKWQRTDPINPGYFNMGFQIVKIAKEDQMVIERIERKYASG